MEKLKSVIIYVLSVTVAFMAGILVFIFGIYAALADIRKETDYDNKNRFSYRNYTKRA